MVKVAKNRRKRKRYGLFNYRKFLAWLAAAAGVVAVLVFLTGVFLKADFFVIAEEGVVSNVALRRPIVADIRGKNIFSVNTRDISERVLSSNPQYSSVIIQKVFPNKIVIRVKGREAFAQLKANRYYVLDKDMVVLDSGSFDPISGLIQVEIENPKHNLAKGDRIEDDNLQRAMRLIEALKESGLKDRFLVDFVNAVNRQGIFFNIVPPDGAHRLGGVRVIVGEGHYQQKIRQLSNLIEGKLKEQLSLVRYIDLRHKKIYVDFSR